MSLPPALTPPVRPKPKQQAAVGFNSVQGLVNEHFARVGYAAIPSLTVTDGVVFFACPCISDRAAACRPTSALPLCQLPSTQLIDATFLDQAA